MNQRINHKPRTKSSPTIKSKIRVNDRIKIIDSKLCEGIKSAIAIVVENYNGVIRVINECNELIETKRTQIVKLKGKDVISV